MDALVVNPPTLRDIARVGLGGKLSYFEFERQTAGADGFRSFPGEHLGLLALTSACRAAGLEVVPVNGQVAYHRSLDETWDMMVRAAPDGPAVVGFSGPCQVLDENIRLARRVRDTWPDARVVMGHDFATLNYQRLLEKYDCLDAVVLGEGEEAFPAIVRASVSGRPLEDIAGVATRAEGSELQVAPPPASPLDLDSLPWVARDHLANVVAAGMSGAVYGSRGCPYRCTYCTTGQTAGLLHGRLGHRLRSVEDLVDEIESIVVDFEISHLTIVDDLFVTSNPESRERARRFADAVRQRPWRVPFMIDARVDSIDEPTFAALSDAGLHRVFVGVETGSSEQLAYYRKHYGQGAQGTDFVQRQMRVLADLKIEVVPGIITYHPETEPAELVETIAAIDAAGYRGMFQFMNRVFVHPGTALWRDYRERGLLSEDWPIPEWEFKDARAAAIEREVLDAIASGCEFDEVRKLFEQAVHSWSREAGAAPELQ